MTHIHAKRGNTFLMPVKFSGLNLDNCSRIDFVFKQEKNENSETLKQSVYLLDGTGDAQRHASDSTVIMVPWTEEESYKFCEYAFFYMDTKIHMTGTDYMPMAEIVQLTMSATLFEDPSDDNG